MECPECQEELHCIDYFGRYLTRGNWDVRGDIYQCDNEECNGFQDYYHTYRNNSGNLQNGYPC